MIILLAVFALLTFFIGYVVGFIVQIAAAFVTGRLVFLIPAIIADALFPFPGLQHVPLVTSATIVALVLRTLLRKYVRV